MGIQPSEFWRLTPYQFGVLVASRVEEIDGERKFALWTAWHAAALQRVGTMPKLEKLLGIKKSNPSDWKSLKAAFMAYPGAKTVKRASKSK